MSNKRLVSIFLLIGLGIILLMMANILWGSVLIEPQKVIQVLFSDEKGFTGESLIIWDYRIPQLLVAVFAGAGLAVAGLLLQTLFRNPLADPSILGISSGASLGVALLLFLSGSFAGSLISSL